MLKYEEIKNRQPKLVECFFAFSKKQYEEGIRTKQLEGKKVFSAGFGGLYGTEEGIEALSDFYDNISREIAEKCTPEEVYKYEYANHECEYTGDDSEALKIVILYFGADRAREVTPLRKGIFYRRSIDDLAKEVDQ